MAYRLFEDRFPEIAKTETRTVTFAQQCYSIPPGDYTFFEMFCDEKGCDCRRVFLHVICNKISDDPLAVIAYGWESEDFYIKWFGENDRKMIKVLKGPCLNDASPQSIYAVDLLWVFAQYLVSDKAYIDRVKKHYEIYRSTIESKKIVDFHEKKAKKRIRNK